MRLRRILAVTAIAAYLLAAFLPSIASKSYYKTYLLHGWEVIYLSAVLSVASSIDLSDRAALMVGTVSNFLFILAVASFAGRQLGRWSWAPSETVTVWISALSLICSVASATMAAMAQNGLLIGAYFWMLSPLLLLLASLRKE
jgi:hypothetical protein